MEFKHIWAFFVENLPTITDADGKTVELPKFAAEGAQGPRSTNVAPGKEVELYEWSFDLRPKGESGNKGSLTIHGSGKFSLQCDASLARPAAIRTTRIPRWISSPPGSWNWRSRPTLHHPPQSRRNDECQGVDHALTPMQMTFSERAGVASSASISGSACWGHLLHCPHGRGERFRRLHLLRVKPLPLHIRAGGLRQGRHGACSLLAMPP